MRPLISQFAILTVIFVAACHNHDHGEACGDHGHAHDGHCHCDDGYAERDGVCVLGADDAGPAVDAVTDAVAAVDGADDAGPRPVDGGPARPDAGVCDGRGHLHGGACHCDDGYVARGRSCEPAPPCADDDPHEPNDTGAAATPWTSAVSGAALRVCEGRPDWFRLRLGLGQTLTARARFRHASGDIDLGLWHGGVDTSHRAPLARADSATDEETLRYTATVEGEYWLGVIVYGRGDLPYSLTVETAP